MTFTLTCATDEELDDQLRRIMEKRGYVITSKPPERIGVGELARRLGRDTGSVSRSLRRGSCPEFKHAIGKKKFLWLEPNDLLLAFLRAEPRNYHTD